MDPKRFSITDGRFYVGERPIIWATVSEVDGSFYHYRHISIPFESGDCLWVSWSDGSFSDNYERRDRFSQETLPFIDEPISVETWVNRFGGNAKWHEPFATAARVDRLIDVLTAPRPFEEV